MIIVTGAAGFIGSCLVARLNEMGHMRDVVVVDDFYKDYKDPNLDRKFVREWIHRDIFLNWFEQVPGMIDMVVHLGARTDTAEQSVAIFDELNLNYSKKVWDICTRYQIPLVYASSAATYGDGTLGYSDDHSLVHDLKPLNPYGQSKQDFDVWALAQKEAPPFWAGVKFFNVYGPNEYHKGRMASVVYHTYHQIDRTGSMKLFRSHRPDVKDGEQQRDFIYVKDVVEALRFLINEQPASGLYNLGTGQARTFLDLASQTFQALELDPSITFIDTPADIRDTYQYFTQADMTKLIEAGYDRPFTSLEDGITEYVQEYLKSGRYW
ncbi:MAG: ADP-glyceromanno-heptose 6-epimerase [Saprospiraceae bacterium]|nr:ADP-glyceromanno-heptose 6-epimerase [Saprospiraceae bacterium]MCB9313924.1 ADP-glyceromanno-heptose 6-epimerase [Lewinellaceae bacterium]HRW75985.1 ADP-glyceromanno-heptose 6-epimerase [Saprospiraceae bacterium]